MEAIYTPFMHNQFGIGSVGGSPVCQVCHLHSYRLRHTYTQCCCCRRHKLPQSDISLVSSRESHPICQCFCFSCILSLQIRAVRKRTPRRHHAERPRSSCIKVPASTPKRMVIACNETCILCLEQIDECDMRISGGNRSQNHLHTKHKSPHKLSMIIK